MTPEQAREKGVEHRSSLLRLKERIKNNEKVDWNRGVARRLISYTF